MERSCLADLASTACRIGARLPISSPVMAVVFEAQLKALGHPPMAERRIREFLSMLGLSYRRKSITTKTHTAEEAGEAVKNVREKLTLIMNLHDIDASRIINVDETSGRMVPLGDRGWETLTQALGDKKRQTTVVLCRSTSADVPLKAQVQSLPPKSMEKPSKSVGKLAKPRVQ